VPPLLELDRLAATHRQGMLELALPVEDSVKPRRIEIAGIADAHHSQKQIARPCIRRWGVWQGRRYLRQRVLSPPLFITTMKE
jgi:hypothetical protein